MQSVIEKIYEDIFKSIEKYVDNKECIACDKATAKLLKEFKQYLPLNQTELFDKLWCSVLDGNYAYGLAQFKGGFKLGFKLACECLKV